MTNFYEITPLDTLFFRGSTPMEAGQYSAISLFPPPASVLKGAFWTAYCKKNAFSFSENLHDGEIPIAIRGFFIKKTFDNGKEKYYVPAPATWYYDSGDKAKKGSDCKDNKLCIALDKSNTFSRLNMKSSAGSIVFVVPKEDAKPLANAWICIDFIKEPKANFSEDSVLLTSDIYSFEARTGVALDMNKIAKDGQLYSSTHIRLHEDISFVICLESDFDFGEGKILLGGEQRVSAYKKAKDILFTEKFTENNSKQYLSLMPIEATEENLSVLVASSKLFVTSGWDMAKGFHKPSVSWIPAGAVFSKKINNSCISLKDKRGE